MPLRTIHVGVGGRGAWPVRLIPERDDYEIAALVDVNPAKLAEAREITGLGEKFCFSSLDDALQAVEADVVVVITPPDFHAKQCEQAVRAGRHVLVEKPFTKDLAMAHALCRQAEAAGVRIGVCQNRRYTSAPMTLRRLLAEGTIGTPSYGLQTTFGWRPGTHHSGLDRHAYLWERGIHDLDILRFIFSAEPVRVWGHSFNPSWSPYAGGGAVQGWIEFSGGISFGLLTTFVAHGKGSSLRIEGDEGMLELQGGELHLHRQGREPEAVPLAQAPRAEGALLDHFHRYVTTGTEPDFSGRNNLATVGLVEAMGAASDHGTVLDFAEYMRMRTS